MPVRKSARWTALDNSAKLAAIPHLSESVALVTPLMINDRIEATWPQGGGEAGHLIRTHDWSKTSLGPSIDWPQSLRTSIDLMLPAKAQIAMMWGPELIVFYNDAYAPTQGNKHPVALGSAAHEVWEELWDDLAPLLHGVRETGETVSAHDRPFHMNRYGYMEEVFFDISYSAIRDEEGGVAGVLCIVSETTQRVRAERQLRASEAIARETAERLELALDSGAVIGTWIWDVKADRFTGDERFANTFAIDASALRHGLPLAEVKQAIHRDDMARVERLMAEAMAKGGAYRAEYRVQDGNGAWRWLEANGRVELDAAGKAARFPGVLLDIGERRQLEEVRKVETAARQQVEEDLRETHDQLRLAQVSCGIGVFQLDIASDVIAVSPEFCHLFGLPFTPTIPASVVENLIHQGDQERGSSSATRATGEAPLDVEYRIRIAGSDEVRWIARRAEFVRDAAGTPVILRGVVQDVTNRKLIETTLRESEAQFRALAQAIPNQAWTATPDGQLDWVNERTIRYSGLPAVELLGDKWAQIVHPDDLPRAAELWRQALDARVRYETEFRIRRADGRYRWHIARALPFDNANSGVRWVGTNTDIDDQKVAQATLADLNASLEQRVNQRTQDLDRMWRLTTDIMLVCRFDGTLTAVNPAWNTLLGWNEAELRGNSFMEYVHPDDIEITQKEIEKLAQGLTTLRFENRYLHRDGSSRTLSWTAVPDEEFIHAVGRDISAEKAAAEALRQTEAQLRQSHKMEAIGQLTGGIAHDFNNLLQGITGSIEVVKRLLAAGRTDNVERFMDSATNSARRAAALIHRLLAFSRQQTLDNQPVDVNQLVISMSELLRRTLGEQVDLQVQLTPDMWPAFSDANQLESAVLNLAINARDAMPDGGRLSIRTSNMTLDRLYAGQLDGLRPGDYAMIAVTDTGVGMSAETVAKAFDPFFTTKPLGQGTGLGLSMIYGFANQSGGHVRIESEIDVGTTIKLYLPRANAPAVLQAEAATRDLAQGAGETVLLVEDDPTVRLLVVEVLHELGYRVLEATNGLEAVPILQSPRKIDLLISDVGLPGLNGRQVAEIARQHRPDLQVLFITGYAEHMAARTEPLASGVRMISKPFAIDELALKIRESFREAKENSSKK